MSMRVQYSKLCNLTSKFDIAAVLGTATVREAMRFSAYLRQPQSISQEEKNEYVEEMIELLELQDLSEALVFSLNVEARKRLTIGVELASKPELLLFLDEPTSGLDAQRYSNRLYVELPMLTNSEL
jgi:ABC-type multidrug transport system ATPase subunit